jgi:hypothetical protein
MTKQTTECARGCLCVIDLRSRHKDWFRLTDRQARLEAVLYLTKGK